MNDDTIEQRIRYLVEHGGLWDDPLADIRRKINWLTAGLAALALLHLVCMELFFRR